MKKTVTAMMALLLAAVFFISCERADMYNMATTEMPVSPAVFIFNAGQFTGNLGGRLGADSICRYAWQAQYFQSGEISHVRAFLSTGGLDSIRNTLPPEYQYLPVYGLTINGPTVVISDNWTNLWDSSIEVILGTALGLSTLWWNASTIDGNSYILAGCEGWTTDSASSTARTGDFATISTTWIFYSNSTCDNSYHLLCVAY